MGSWWPGLGARGLAGPVADAQQAVAFKGQPRRLLDRADVDLRRGAPGSHGIGVVVSTLSFLFRESVHPCTIWQDFRRRSATAVEQQDPAGSSSSTTTMVPPPWNTLAVAACPFQCSPCGLPRLGLRLLLADSRAGASPALASTASRHLPLFEPCGVDLLLVRWRLVQQGWPPLPEHAPTTSPFYSTAAVAVRRQECGPSTYPAPPWLERELQRVDKKKRRVHE